MTKQEINEFLTSLTWDGKDRLAPLKWDGKERVLDFISDLLEPLQPSLSRIACLIQEAYPVSPKAHQPTSYKYFHPFLTP